MILSPTVFVYLQQRGWASIFVFGKEIIAVFLCPLYLLNCSLDFLSIGLGPASSRPYVHTNRGSTSKCLFSLLFCMV